MDLLMRTHMDMYR